MFCNPNAFYYLDVIKKDFEFFNAIDPRVSHPLSINIYVFHIIPTRVEILNKFYSYDYKFNNLSILDNVYQHVEKTVKTINRFYLTVMFNTYPPIKFCNDSKFALKNRFHYVDLISKHIGYIEKVRWDILKGNIYFKLQVGHSGFDYKDSSAKDAPIKVLTDINGWFIYWIEKYIGLFFTTYQSILNKIEMDENKMDNHSRNTFYNFKKLNDKITIIKQSDFNDFNTKIETNE